MNGTLYPCRYKKMTLKCPLRSFNQNKTKNIEIPFSAYTGHASVDHRFFFSFLLEGGSPSTAERRKKICKLVTLETVPLETRRGNGAAGP